MARKKEKEYSFEEAMHIARQAALPNWYYSEPLFCGSTNEEGEHYPQPLLDTLSQGAWCIFFCSLTGWTLPRTLLTYVEWNRRFHNLGIQFIFVFRERFPLLTGRLATEDWITRNGIKGAVACDTDGEMNRAFGEESYPRLVILNAGEITMNTCGQNWLEGAEKEIHRILRVESPGLPFQLPWQEKEAYPDEKGFAAVVENGAVIEKHGFKIEGRWHLDRDHLWTQDPAASLEMTAPYSDVGIIAECMTEGSGSTKINVASLNGAVPEVSAGKDCHQDNDGSLTATVHYARTYFLFHKLPGQYRKLKFKFPLAHEVPVKIYGFEFAES